MVMYFEMGVIWSYEYGFCGGDEINIVKVGVNYGWFEIIYGINYIGIKIIDEISCEGME